METTTRKLTTLQPPSFSKTPSADPAPDTGRPWLPDAPDWFNRARVRTNQRKSVVVRPAPRARNCFIPVAAAAGRWRIPHRTIALGLSLMALPAVFLSGFWTHRIVAPVHRDVARNVRSDVPIQGPVGQEMPAQDFMARDWKGEFARPFINLPTAPDTAPAKINVSLLNIELPKPIERPAEVAQRRRPPKPSTIAANLDADTQPFNQVVQFAPIEPAQAVQPERPALRDGFSLRSPVAAQFVADVHVPGNSWFSLAGATADCESGTCKLVPVKTADRKLNTALEWSTTPQLAAEQAAREGKLVFLIHVSGNFSQPGFT